MTIRVGFTGYSTSGKDAAADALVECLGFVKIGMSTALLADALKLDPWIDIGKKQKAKKFEKLTSILSKIGYDDAKAIYPEFRVFLQILGTEVGRQHDPYLWVKALNRLASEYEKVATSGIRFVEELEGIDFLIHISRPGIGPINDHASDSIQDVVDRSHVTIVNDGDIEQLHRKTIDVVQTWLNVRSA